MSSNDTEAGDKKRGLAQWAPPATLENCQLRLLNSLTRNKEVFTPINGRQVSWYICGPTVYDGAHMGHARSYVSFDIVRRVLRSYFDYDVRYVMNVTDIDDKIIKRARQRHLFHAYAQSIDGVGMVLKDFDRAVGHFGRRLAAETNDDKKNMLQKQVEKAEAVVGKWKASGNAKISDVDLKAGLENLFDVLSEWLDSEKGRTVVDLDIFTNLARFYEEDYHQDMASLGVLPPDVLTRVSEYVPEIVAYIEKIIENGFAYEAGGSVYFDTVKYDNANDHHYAKLVPEAFGDQNALKEGEGELSVGEDRAQAKRNNSDFALWKASKAGEPFWESPWGNGRPGWHIECSAMASAICGDRLDIHSGGFDLKFPHHDNEIAQSEAYFGSRQWANYWLHAGTLRIAGLKMSKSLKNFITIKDALTQYTARQLRILFLLHNWSDVLDFSPKTMEFALNLEKAFGEFFLTVKHHLRGQSKNSRAFYQKFDQPELSLNRSLHAAENGVRAALCDSLDTRGALFALRELVADANAYMVAKDAAQTAPNAAVLRNAARYATRILRVFGVAAEGADIGFGDGGREGGGAEEQLMPYLKAIVDFRESVRTSALEDPKVYGSFLKECDKFRNETLPNLGVRLEDKHGDTVIKLVDPEETKREAALRKAHDEQKRLEKERKETEKAEKEAKARIHPTQLFRQELEKFSRFDEAGIPTHDEKGEEISKKQRKKLEKIHELHSKKYKELMEKGDVANGQ